MGVAAWPVTDGLPLVRGVTVCEAIATHRARIVSDRVRAPGYFEVKFVALDAAGGGPLQPPAASDLGLSRYSVENRSGRVEVHQGTVGLFERKIPGKAHWLHAGARGSIGCACAGGETVRNNPTAVIAVAAASNGDLFTLVNCDIGNPFHLTPSIRKENDLFGRWRENRTRRPLTLKSYHEGGLE